MEGIVLRNIEAERVRNGWTTDELSQRLGISRKTYQGYVRKTPIPAETLRRLRETLNCSLDYLLEAYPKKQESEEPQ